MFRGPDDADSLIICPVTGFPVKFNSAQLDIFLSEKRRKLNFFFKHTQENLFPEWGSIEMRLAWYGLNWRNASADIQHLMTYIPYEPAYQERMEHYPGSEYCPENVDPEVFFWYHESYGELEEYANWRVPEEEVLSLDIIVPAPVEESDDDSYEPVHDSDSDEIEDYLKGQFLNEGSEDEENPVDISSKDSEEESDN